MKYESKHVNFILQTFPIRHNFKDLKKFKITLTIKQFYFIFKYNFISENSITTQEST